MLAPSLASHTDAPSGLPNGERLTWDLDEGCGGNRKFRRRIFQVIPEAFHSALAARYRDLYVESECEANLFLLDTVEHFNFKTISLAASDERLVEIAACRARECARIVSRLTSRESAYELAAKFAGRNGVVPPAPTHGTTLEGALARLCDEFWWRRALRRTVAQAVEESAIDIGLVHRNAGLYVSDESLRRRTEQKRRNRRTLHKLLAINETGEEVAVAELLTPA